MELIMSFICFLLAAVLVLLFADRENKKSDRRKTNDRH